MSLGGIIQSTLVCIDTMFYFQLVFFFHTQTLSPFKLFFLKFLKLTTYHICIPASSLFMLYVKISLLLQALEPQFINSILFVRELKSDSGGRVLDRE